MPAGNYCSARMPKLCTKCSYVDDLKQSVQNVIDRSIQLQSRNSILMDYTRIRDSFASNLLLIQSTLTNAKSKEGEDSLNLNTNFLLALVELQKSEVASIRGGPTKTMMTTWITEYHALLTEINHKQDTSGVVKEADVTNLKAHVKKSEEILEMLDKKIEETSVNTFENLLVGDTPVDVSRRARSYLRNLEEFIRKSKKREQVEENIQENIIKILEKDTRSISMKEVIALFNQAFSQLAFAKQQWTNFQALFGNIADVLKRTRKNVDTSIDLYKTLDLTDTEIPDREALFRNELKQNIMEALAFSTYTKR